MSQDLPGDIELLLLGPAARLGALLETRRPTPMPPPPRSSTPAVRFWVPLHGEGGGEATVRLEGGCRLDLRCGTACFIDVTLGADGSFSATALALGGRPLRLEGRLWFQPGSLRLAAELTDEDGTREYGTEPEEIPLKLI